MRLLEDLAYRGLIYQNTDPEKLDERLEQKPIVLYCGFDPTADSLHIGHLLPILILRRFQQYGHQPIALVGGGTGLIGDPSGKASERTLNTKEVVQGYSDSIRSQLSRFLDFEKAENPALIANNYDWLGELEFIPFLRDVGKHFPLNYMLAKESVNSRLEKGISFTEFSYMILQAYDYLELHRRYGCELQVGGSDQWGNITAGTELIRKTGSKSDELFGLTIPLVTKSDGTKFGKTEGGAVWLDAKKTSPYLFYQFWLNTDDADVIKYLKYFTFLTKDQIEILVEAVETAPEKRDAQRTLAEEMTRLVHGEEALQSAQNITAALFQGKVSSLTASEIAEGFQDVPSAAIEGNELPLIDVLIQVGAAKSKREAREFVQNGAVSVNDERITDISTVVNSLKAIDDKYLVIRRGKKKYFLAELSSI
ncbi:tyrosine--tRNA ligase [Shimazuella alba]|uniref:Tyrosine--tRNA ligase n=1 Tax=Shimazuella alba TaxID=2690964 RepID=A0A6I4W2E0_9BACL|nr:tyrosine--tRNA ligase [Shimazuella alba]MXQ54472.1 tyrosine--tRNA ligase [Shimazuella alba]